MFAVKWMCKVCIVIICVYMQITDILIFSLEWFNSFENGHSWMAVLPTGALFWKYVGKFSPSAALQGGIGHIHVDQAADFRYIT